MDGVTVSFSFFTDAKLKKMKSLLAHSFSPSSLPHVRGREWDVVVFLLNICSYKLCLWSWPTPSVLVKEVVLDKIWVKHWEYKLSRTFKLLSLQMWKLYDNMNRFVLKNTFIKVYVYHFSINIFLKIRGQSCVLETVSLS